MQSNVAVPKIKLPLLSDAFISMNGSNILTKDTLTVSALYSSNRKRVVDETLLTSGEAKALEKRRAYNRECATRARKRVKQSISQLEDQIKELLDDKTELRRCLAAMEKQVVSLTKEKKKLLVKIQATTDSTHISHMIYNNRIGGRTNPPSTQLLQLQVQLLQQQQLNSFQGRGFY
jgi:septal ring factor EnvC (AmiA/AmiB activator)